MSVEKNDSDTIKEIPTTVFQTLTSNKSAITRIDHCVVNSISNRRDLRCVLDCDEQNYPILILIYHGDRTIDLLTSEIVNEFLEMNYVVCSYDISNAVDQQRLMSTWMEYSLDRSMMDFSIDQCPILIGMMKSIRMDFSLSYTYETELLLIENVLVRTHEEYELELLFYQLIVFREEFIKNERYLSSRFVRSITSCPELVLSICEYLSLNDAVETFTLDVLSLLWKYNRKLPVINPSTEFLNLITQTNNCKKIVDLRVNASRFNSLIKSSPSDTFTHVRSLSIHQFGRPVEISRMNTVSLHPTHLSISYDGKLDFQTFYHIFELIPSSVMHFTVSCDSISCSHYRPDILFVKASGWNVTIENFLLRVNHTSRSLVNNCFQRHEKCILRTIIDFIKIMSLIRNIRIVTQGSIEPLLDLIEWTTSMDMCRRVERIQLKGRNIILQDHQLMENIQQITDELHKIRQTIEFHVEIK